MLLIENIEFSIYSPNNLVIPLRERPTVTRDELLLQRAVTDDALHDYERGYEHLPEVMDADINKALKQLEKFGDDWWDTEGGIKASERLTAIVHQKQRQQFESDFYPTIPPEVREKRKLLISTIADLLEKCRARASWSERSEYKLDPYIDRVPEDMIPYTSIPNLLRIVEGLKEYYRIHLEMDAKRQ